MEQTAGSTLTAARTGGEFFYAPTESNHRRYEALRAYLADGEPTSEVAARFGYTEATIASMVRDFRAGRRDFFVVPRPGPTSAPAKNAARSRIVELRQAGRSAYEIATVLAQEGIPLNRTGVAEVLAEQDFPRLQPRPHAERGLPRRAEPTRTKVIDFDTWSQQQDTKQAGLLLTVADLVALDLPGIVEAAGYPGTSVIPALSSILSLLALKLTAVRRVSHRPHCLPGPTSTHPRIHHRNPRYPATKVPDYGRHDHHYSHRNRRPRRPPHLLARPAPSRPPRHHRAVVG